MKPLNILFLLLFASLWVSGQTFYQSPYKLFDEDFTDQEFDDYGSGSANDRWSLGGYAKFDTVNDRPGIPYAVLRDISDGTGNGWDALAHWYLYDDQGEHQNILIDKHDDVTFLRFKAFSDVAGQDISPDFAVEVAMLEDKSGAPFGHDLSFEVSHVFIRDGSYEGPLQLDPNAENTSAPQIDATSRSHHNVANGRETPETLENEYESQICWRNKPKEGKTNIELWGALNSGEFDVNEPMDSDYEPIVDSAYSVFNHVQIALFDKNEDNTDPMTFRDGYDESNAQVGIAYCALGITKKSDFTLDYIIDEKDADTLAAHWNQISNVTIKQGDATNDNVVNIDDANPLIGFWSDSLAKTVSASATYNNTTGEILLSLKNVSYFKIKGPPGAFNGSKNPDFTGLSPLKTTDNDTVIGGFTKDEWAHTDYNLGTVAVSSLNVDDLKLVINYKGSGLSEGITLDFGEEFVNFTAFPDKEAKKTFFFDGQRIILNKESDILKVRIYNTAGVLQDVYHGGPGELNHTTVPGKGFRILHIEDEHNTHYSKKYVKF